MPYATSKLCVDDVEDGDLNIHFQHDYGVNVDAKYKGNEDGDDGKLPGCSGKLSVGHVFLNLFELKQGNILYTFCPHRPHSSYLFALPFNHTGRN